MGPEANIHFWIDMSKKKKKWKKGEKKQCYPHIKSTDIMEN